MACTKALAVGGIVGPASFIGAWIAGGLSTDGYSPVNDAISRLAAVHAPTRVLMTGGFVAFTVGVGSQALAMRRDVPGRSWVSAAVAAVATLGVAALPLDHSSTVDLLHGAAASTGYVALAATPWIAAPVLKEAGYESAARASKAISIVSALSLAATILGPAHGFFQRLGLTVSDLWLIAFSFAIVSGRVRGPS